MQKNNLSTLDEISSYRRSYPAACLVMDTNVLLLFFIGIFNSEYLKECPLMTDNGKNYEKKHFELMEKILKIFINKVIITPHILSEINMLTRKKIKPEPRMDAFFQKLIQQLESCQEEQVEMKMILKNGGVIKFGFADISLIEAAMKNKWAVLTDELPLYTAYRTELPVIYFSNLVANEIYKVSL